MAGSDGDGEMVEMDNIESPQGEVEESAFHGAGGGGEDRETRRLRMLSLCSLFCWSIMTPFFLTILIWGLVVSHNACSRCSGLLSVMWLGLIFLLAFLVVSGGLILWKGGLCGKNSVQDDPLSPKERKLNPTAQRKFKMQTGAKFGCSCLVFTVLIVVSALSMHLIMWSRTVPKEVGELTVQGLQFQVTVKWDTEGLPSVHAQSEPDAMFAMGLLHARDRLFQMELERLAGKGRLSSMVGEAALDTDRITLTFGFWRQAQKVYAEVAPQTKEMLKAYAAGVNEGMDRFPKSPDLSLLRHTPEAWSPEDAVLAFKLMQWDNSGNFNREILRWRLYITSGKTHRDIEGLMPMDVSQYPILGEDHYKITPEGLKRYHDDFAAEAVLYENVMDGMKANGPSVKKAGKVRDRTRQASKASLRGGSQEDSGLTDPLGFFSEPLPKGSNTWVWRGKPNTGCIQASDPHLGLSLPEVWYYMHIYIQSSGSNDGGSGRPTQFHGVTHPGIPFGLIGRTESVSWGITLLLSDITDLFVLDVSESGNSYRQNTTQVDFEVVEEQLMPKGKDPINYPVKISKYGPVISDAMKLPGPPVALWTSALSLNDAPCMDSLIRMWNVDTAPAFLETMSKVQSPGLSISYGDSLGGYGWVTTAPPPRRAVGHTGRFPTIGDGSMDYQGMVDWEEMPRAYVPPSGPSGYFAAANQLPVHYGALNFNLGYDYVSSDRGARIHDMLSQASQEELGQMESHERWQTDELSEFFAKFSSILTHHTFNKHLDDGGEGMKNFLSVWDGNSTLGRYEPSVFWLWMMEIGKLPKDIIEDGGYRLTTDEAANEKIMEQEIWWLSAYNLAFHESLLSNANPIQKSYCMGATGTTSDEACVIFAAQALNSAAVEYEERGEPEWGVDMHMVYLKHPVMSQTPLGCIWRREYRKGGDMVTVNQAGGRVTEDLDVTHGPSMRQLNDLRQVRNSRWAFPAGSSGNPFSPYYDNIIQTYAENRYLRIMHLESKYTLDLIPENKEE